MPASLWFLAIVATVALAASMLPLTHANLFTRQRYPTNNGLPRIRLHQYLHTLTPKPRGNGYDPTLSFPLQTPRGGAYALDDEEDMEVVDSDFDSDIVDDVNDENETNDDDDDDNDLLGMMDDMEDAEFVEDGDFAEDDVLKRAMVAFLKTPPLTKAYLSASMIATLYGYLMNRNQFPSFLALEWKPTLTKLQIWRPFTAFLNFGPLGIGYPLTAHFVWEYMSTLERYCHKRPYDFWIMIVFGQLAMIVGYPLLKLSPRFLGHNLSTYLVYIWSRYHEGLGIRLFEAFETRAELLPWFFLAQTFLLEGEPPVLDFLGIVFGHIYHYCKTVGLLRAPPAWVTWYEQSTAPWVVAIRQRYKDISSEFEMVD